MDPSGTRSSFRAAVRHGPVFLNLDQSVERACALIYAQLQTDLITKGHLLLDTDGHYSRPYVFHSTPTCNLR